jgi:hypothetical protein
MPAKKLLAAEMRKFKTELEHVLSVALTTAPDERPCGSYHLEKFGCVEFRHADSTFQLRLFRSRPVIEETLMAVKRLPVTADPLNPPPAPKRERDELDAALDIYGDAHTAAVKLQGQLDMAAELGLDERQAARLDNMIVELKRRAAVTNIPEKQRTAIVDNVEQMEQIQRAREAHERSAMAAKAAESHPDMPELKRLIEEHKARNAKLGIANESGQGGPSSVASPLTFVPSYSIGWAEDNRVSNTRHNGKIRALQERIATPLHCWNRKTKRVELWRYWGE